jgi:uncharacterized protein YcnI
MKCRSTALAVAAGALIVPAAAQAHVTVHPNSVPEGAFAVISVRVPNEEDNVDTTKVVVQFPEGFGDVSLNPPAGWKATVKTKKPPAPIKTDDGTIDEEVSTVTFSGGTIPPGQFREFPISAGIPGKAGDTLTFKALQTYSNGKVVRWIGSPDADTPAPTISINDTGVLQDVTGDHDATANADTASTPSAAPAATTQTVVKKETSGLSVVALILGALGLVAGGLGLSASRRA